MKCKFNCFYKFQVLIIFVVFITVIYYHHVVYTLRNIGYHYGFDCYIRNIHVAVV
jgi:hypothetical protein